MAKQEYWYFTFGAGQEFEGYYVIVRGCGFTAAREKMVKKYGTAWSGQYTIEEFLSSGMWNTQELLEEL
jgi:hypothetical protein